MAFQTEEFHLWSREHLRIRRAVRRMASLTAFLLNRRMFIYERPLFIGVAFQAGRISRDRIAQ